MNDACGESKSCGRAAGEGEAGEETANRIGAKLVVLLGRYDGENRIAVRDRCWGYTGAGSENRIHCGGTEVSKTQVAIHGGGCNELWE